MGLKDLGCGMCAWFSLIGSSTFAILAIMLTRKNEPVIEHKFHLKIDDEEKIAHLTTQMWTMVALMIAASISCFAMQGVYAK